MDRKRIFAVLAILISAVSFSCTASATTYPMPKPGDDLVGEMFTVSARAGDSLRSIGNRYSMSLYEMLEANQQIKNPRSLNLGEKIFIPAQFILPSARKGIVINLAELRLYYFTPDGKYVMTYPVGVGRRDWRTPIIVTRVVNKTPNPDWRVPKDIKQYAFRKYNRLLPDMVKGGDPENPLGHYAVYLAKPEILIHGTNQQDSVGTYISSGCIRLHAQDIEELYNNVKIGAPVYIMNVSQKAGWLNNQLYLESQIPLRLTTDVSIYNHDSASSALQNVLSRYRDAHVDEKKAKQVVSNRTGIPEVIGYRSSNE